MANTKTQINLLAILLAISLSTAAQDMVSTTKVSQKATTTQTIGTTDITVVYHSPLAKDRTIFGKLVPYEFEVDGKEYPWRSGSNQNTTIEFSHPVMIEGHKLDSGKYGLHVFVTEKEWTFIFSNNSKSWGSFQYDKNDDALRVTVPSMDAAYQNWLSYNFNDREAESVNVELRWSKKKAVFNVVVDVTNNIIADLTAKEEKTAGDYLNLARNELKKDPNATEKALMLVNQSIANKPGFHNKIYKADLLIKSGDKNQGMRLKKEALDSAKGFDMYYYGLSLYLIDEDKMEAFKVLSENAKNNPEDWIAHLALGEYYIKEGDQGKVVEHFEKAFKYSTDNWRNYARYLYLSNKIILK